MSVSTLGLLIPNWSNWTVVGIVLIIIGAIILRISSGKKKIRGKDVGAYGWMFILAGFVMSWGISILQDLSQSENVRLIFWGCVVVIALYIIMNWRKK